MIFSPAVLERPAPNVMLDISAELAYWQKCYPLRRFFHGELPFPTYVPTLKFGYDMYLSHHRDELTELLPNLRTRYLSWPSREQLDWKDAEQIISACWERMSQKGF